MKFYISSLERILQKLCVIFMIFLSVFVFVACGSTHISKDEAFKVISSLLNEDKFEQTKDFTINKIEKITQKNGNTERNSEINTNVFVNEIDGKKIGQVALNGNAIVYKDDSGLNIENNTNFDISFKVAQIGSSYCFVNENLQQKQIVNYQSYLNWVDFQTLLDIKIITPSDIEANYQEPAKFEIKSENNIEAEPVLTGENIIDAYVSCQKNENDSYEYGVVIEFDAEGAQKFYELTTAQQGNSIYIFINDELFSAPTVNSAISSGATFISGGMNSYEEAEEFALQILSSQQDFRVTTDFIKLNNNDYNFNILINNDISVSEHKNIRYYYEFRNGSLTKYIYEERYVEQNNEKTVYEEYNIKYSANKVDIPDDISNYTEKSFDIDLGDFLSS